MIVTHKYDDLKPIRLTKDMGPNLISPDDNSLIKLGETCWLLLWDTEYPEPLDYLPLVVADIKDSQSGDGSRVLEIVAFYIEGTKAVRKVGTIPASDVLLHRPVGDISKDDPVYDPEYLTDAMRPYLVRISHEANLRVGESCWFMDGKYDYIDSNGGIALAMSVEHNLIKVEVEVINNNNSVNRSTRERMIKPLDRAYFYRPPFV